MKTQLNDPDFLPRMNIVGMTLIAVIGFLWAALLIITNKRYGEQDT